MKSGFAPILIVLFVAAIGVFGTVLYYNSQIKLSEANNSKIISEKKTKNTENEAVLKGLVIDVRKLENQDYGQLYLLRSDDKVYKVEAPGGYGNNKGCFDILPIVYSPVEVKGNLNGEVIKCEPPNGYIKSITPTSPVTLDTFIASNGKEKFILADLKTNPMVSIWGNVYLSTKKGDLNNAIRIFEVGPSDISRPNVSKNSGVKYLVMGKGGPGDHQEFILFDENGNVIEIDLSRMGLGTTIRGMYGLNFGGWVADSTTFKILAGSGDGSLHLAIIDGLTGKQIGKTEKLQ